MSLTHTTDRRTIQSLFKKYDKDDSGHINKFELQNLISDLGLEFDDEQCRALIMYIDADNSGRINFEEFYNCWSSLVQDHVFNANTETLETKIYRLTYAANLFNNYDTNKSRTLSKNEFSRFYKDLYQRYNANMKEIESALKYIDKSGDGEISFQEFIKWLGWLNC